MSKMYLIALPILPNKLEQWKQFTHTLKTEKQHEYESARQKAGVRSEKIWHQSTPQGDQLLQVLELDGSVEDFLHSLTQTNGAFETWFLEQIKDIHGLTIEQIEALPAHDLVFAWNSPTVFEKTSETALGIGQNLAQTAQGILGKATEAAGTVGKKVGANASELAGKAQSQAQETAQQFQKSAQEKAQELRKNVETKTSELLNQAGENVAEATQQMQAKASEALGKSAEMGQAAAGKATDFFNQALGIFGKKEDKASESETEKPKEADPTEAKLSENDKN